MGLFTKRDQYGETTVRWGVVVPIVIAAIVGVAALMSSVWIVDQTEVGVVKVLGKVQPEPLYPGVHLVPPFISEVITMPIYEKTIEMTKQNENPVKALTSEGLPVTMDIAIQYRVDPEKAPELYSKLKNYEVWMKNRIRAHVRDVIAMYKAEALYTVARAEIQKEITTKLTEEFEPYGIIITAVLIRDIDLPADVIEAIEAKIKAKQEAERMQYLVEKEKLEAERKKVEAEGIARANQIIGESCEHYEGERKDAVGVTGFCRKHRRKVMLPNMCLD